MAEPVGGDLSREFRRLYEAAKLNQMEVAELLGVPQSTISEWARGTSVPRVTAFPMLERHVGVAVGTIVRRAGLVEDSYDVVAAINNDRHLDERGKRLMTNLYELESSRSASPASSLENEPSEAMNPSH